MFFYMPLLARKQNINDYDENVMKIMAVRVTI